MYYVHPTYAIHMLRESHTLWPVPLFVSVCTRNQSVFIVKHFKTVQNVLVTPRSVVTRPRRRQSRTGDTAVFYLNEPLASGSFPKNRHPPLIFHFPSCSGLLLDCETHGIRARRDPSGRETSNMLEKRPIPRVSRRAY